MYVQKWEMKDQHLPGFCPSMGVRSPNKGFDSFSVFIELVSSFKKS